MLCHNYRSLFSTFLWRHAGFSKMTCFGTNITICYITLRVQKSMAGQFISLCTIVAYMNMLLCQSYEAFSYSCVWCTPCWPWNQCIRDACSEDYKPCYIKTRKAGPWFNSRTTNAIKRFQSIPGNDVQHGGIAVRVRLSWIVCIDYKPLLAIRGCDLRSRSITALATVRLTQISWWTHLGTTATHILWVRLIWFHSTSSSNNTCTWYVPANTCTMILDHSTILL